MKHSAIRILSLMLALATLAAAVLFTVSCSGDFGTGGNTSGGNTSGGNTSGGSTGGGNAGDTGDTGDTGDGGDTGDAGDTPVVPSSVVINEVCTKNTRQADKHKEDGQLCDWIELYNQSDNDISLAGWGISDRPKKVKHVFAAGVTVPARGFLVLWACGEETTSDKNGGVSLPFALSKNGEKLYLFNAAGAVADRVVIPAIQDRSSFGRTVDGGDVFAELLLTTRGESNDGADVNYLDASAMEFSHESGFYGEAFDLRIQVPEGYTLYYTDDSSTPTDASKEFPTAGIRIRDRSGESNVYSWKYMGRMEQCYKGYAKTRGRTYDPVDKCTVLRFLLVNDAGDESRVVTKSYFVGSQFSSENGGYQNMSVVSLVSDPYNFFGDGDDVSNALFTNEKYWEKTGNADERPANFTYFSANKEYSFDQDIGVRLHGTSTRGYNQKSLTLFARRKYGAGKFKKAILGGVSDCGSLVLRTDGTTKLQEGFLQSFVSDRAVSTSDYEPTVVFLDGEYYGVFNLMERFSEDYVEAHYGIDSDNVYIVKKGEDSTAEGNTTAAMNSYIATFRKLLNADLSVNRNWQAFINAVDLQSLADYLAIQIFLGNMDWSFAQNIAVWRTADPSLEDGTNPYADGKWRFVLYDLDFAAGCWNAVDNWTDRKGDTRSATNYGAATNPFTTQMPFVAQKAGSLTQIVNLMKNPQFVEKFVLAFEDLCNVNFAPDTAVAKTEAAIARIQGAMTKHFKRFGVPVKAYYSGSKEGVNNDNWKVKTYFGGYSVYPTTVSPDAWAKEMQFLVNFFRDRTTYVRAYLADYCGISGSAVTVNIACGGAAGTVLLNGATTLRLADGESLACTYYTDYMLTVTAVAPEGYVFTGWTVSGATLSSASDPTVKLTLRGNCTLTANFAPQ